MNPTIIKEFLSEVLRLSRFVLSVTIFRYRCKAIIVMHHTEKPWNNSGIGCKQRQANSPSGQLKGNFSLITPNGNVKSRKPRSAMAKFSKYKSTGFFFFPIRQITAVTRTLPTTPNKAINTSKPSLSDSTKGMVMATESFAKDTFVSAPQCLSVQFSISPGGFSFSCCLNTCLLCRILFSSFTVMQMSHANAVGYISIWLSVQYVLELFFAFRYYLTPPCGSSFLYVKNILMSMVM